MEDSIPELKKDTIEDLVTGPEAHRGKTQPKLKLFNVQRLRTKRGPSSQSLTSGK